MLLCHTISLFFFFNDTATTEIYTLSLHDALPILGRRCRCIPLGAGPTPMLRTAPNRDHACQGQDHVPHQPYEWEDRKSTRLNSSHLVISYAVFCLKKKKNNKRS